jgi:hypothetical protein
MIDIYNAKNSLAGFYLNKKYEFNEKNISNLIQIVRALEESKEIIENLKETTRSYAMQTYSKIAHKNADIADEWLSKYFEEPLGNNGEPIKNINPEICEEQLERLSHETE